MKPRAELYLDYLDALIGSKQAEAEKAKWLMYGVPAAVLTGAVVGATSHGARRGVLPGQEAIR
jgi:hypothetical protein